MGRFAVCLALSILFLGATSLSLPEYSYLQHPLYTHSRLTSSPRPSPVIMRKYYRFLDGSRTTNGAFFFPGVASYTLFPSRISFAVSLDALYVDGAPTSTNPHAPYLTVLLNRPARVFLLLNGGGITFQSLHQLRKVSGLGDEWHSPRALRSESGNGIPVGDWERVKRNLFLPSLVASLETTVENGTVLILPHPAAVTVDGQPASRFTLLFARTGPADTMPVAIPFPASPARVLQPVSGMEVDASPALPNQACPEWLHELYVARSRNVRVAKKEGELLYWRSWHPQIDPIYWCYFGHEHGSFPGQYSPLFGYTAWKTPDAGTSHGRQDESHAGFKVFSFPLKEQGRYVVVTVHIHVSDAGRFRKRFHTVGFAVLNERWEVEMELHMKGDFGAAEAALRNGTQVGLDAHEEGVRRELLRRKVVAFRKFNVLNVDEDYPRSVDGRFILNGRTEARVDNLEQVLRGVYEQWQMPLNTCSWARNVINRGLQFDVRDPATGMRDLEGGGGDGEDVQWLAGSSVNRVVVVVQSAGEVEVGTEHCAFDVFRSDSAVSLERSGGVFYTDAYFTVIRRGSGRNNVRQFIKPEFETVRIPVGTVAPTEPWNGFMEYVEGDGVRGRRFTNIENAVVAGVN